MTLQLRSVCLFYLAITIALSSCALGGKIRDGQMAYDRKQYAVATEMLAEEYNDTRSKQEQAHKAYLLGKSYGYMGETAEAVRWLQTSFDKGYGPEVTKALAISLKKSGNYAASIKKYEQLKTQVAGRDQEINREIAVLKTVAAWEEDQRYDYETKVLRSSSPDMDYSAVLFEDDFLVFTSDRAGATGGDIYKWTGADHSDLYIVPKTANKPRKFDAILNSDDNDGAACFSQDYNEIFFTRCFSEDDNKDAFCNIMYSERYTGVWTKPTVIGFTQEGYNYGQPALIEGDSVLVFSADLPASIGGHDLYYSERQVSEEGFLFWTEPAPMPRSINTQGDEMFPVGDGDTLYFSSDYLPGYGGLDIFKTYLKSNGQWSSPQNMRSPINSPEDDYSFVVDRTADLRGSSVEKGFFTSSRKGYGYDDIYSYEKYRRELPPDTLVEDAPNAKQYLITLAVKSRTPEFENANDPNSGRIGYQPLAKVRLVIDDGYGQQETITDDNGILLLEVKQGRDYQIKGSKQGYLNDVAFVTTKNLTFENGELSKTINVSLALPKIYYDQEIVLEKIYYDFNKSNIREDAKVVLDTLAILLRQNPQIQIELSSHTDCRGDDEYNMILSQKRAQSAVDYIVSRGVDSQAVTAKGYGKTVPFSTCECEMCTEEEHQKNRRTSFKILR